MSFHQHRRARMIFMLALLLAIMLVVTSSAQAQGIVGGSEVPAGVVFDHDAFLSGDDIVLDGDVLGDVLAVGRTVTVNGNVAGSLVTLAESVAINGQVDGSLYTGAVTLEVGEPASIGRSTYFAGARLVTQPESQIERDLVAGTLGAQLNGSVGRDVKAVIGLIEIVDSFLKAFNIETGFSGFNLLGSSNSPTISQANAAGKNATLPVALSRPEQARTTYPLGGLTYSVRAQDENGGVENAATVGNWFLERLRLLVQYLIVGALAAWLAPARFHRWTHHLRTRPIASGLYGFVGFVTGFAGTIILIALVAAVGIGLAVLTLRGLSVAAWSLGLSSTWLAFSVFMLFLLFISKIIVSYLGGLLILERLAPRAAQIWIWPLLLGLVIYVLLRAVPFLGLAIGFLVTIFGLGAAILALRQRDIYAWKMVEEEE